MKITVPTQIELSDRQIKEIAKSFIWRFIEGTELKNGRIFYTGTKEEVKFANHKYKKIVLKAHEFVAALNVRKKFM